MKLKLVREVLGESTTHGKLYVDGVFECYTLEDKDRFLESGGTKEYGKTAIPLGEYEVVIDFSNRFKTELPRLLNVPQFEGIRIHPGNTHEDTHGCILVGSTRSGDSVLNSRTTFRKLMTRMESAYARGETISIMVMRE